MAKLSELLKSKTAKAQPSKKADKPADKPTDKAKPKRKRTGRPTNNELIAAGKRAADLITPSQALAAEYYLRGDTKIDAYQKAMRCSRNVAAKASWRLFETEAVRDYVALRIKARAEQNKLEEKRVLTEWMDLLNTALPDVMEVGNCGEFRVKSFHEMTDAEKRSIKKIKIKQRVIVQVGKKKGEQKEEVSQEDSNVETLQLVEQEITVETYSRVDVLRDVGEHLGMFSESEEAKARGVTQAIIDRIQGIKAERQKELNGRVINGEVVSK